jgi:hypothetical protein
VHHGFDEFFGISHDAICIHAQAAVQVVSIHARPCGRAMH